MKKYLFALAACAAIAAADARADFGTPPAPAGAAAAGAPAGGANTYGWNPILKRVMFWKKKDDCAGGKCGPTPGAGVPGIPGNGMAMPGTLVFPTHPFARSPRDYFMYGHGGS